LLIPFGLILRQKKAPQGEGRLRELLFREEVVKEDPS
jgi:hypothetical protein